LGRSSTRGSNHESPRVPIPQEQITKKMFSLVPKIVRDKLSLVFSQMFPDKKKTFIANRGSFASLDAAAAALALADAAFFPKQNFLGNGKKIKLPEDRKSIQEVENKNRTKVILEKQGELSSLMTTGPFLPPILFYSLFLWPKVERRVFYYFFQHSSILFVI